MNKIAIERQKLGLSQVQLAKILGWGRSRLSNYEANLRDPGLVECRFIVNTFNKLGCDCTIDSVFPPKSTNTQKQGACS